MCNFYVDDRCGFKTSYFTHVKWETQYSFRVLKYLHIYENNDYQNEILESIIK